MTTNQGGTMTDQMVAQLESLLDETIDPVRNLRDSAEAERIALQERIKDLSQVIGRCNRVIAASQPPQPTKPKEEKPTRRQEISAKKREEGEAQVLDWFRTHDEISPSDLVNNHGWNSPQASYLFRDLRDDGIIRLAGRGAGGRKLYKKMEKVTDASA